jgi:hypothetical protein
MMSEWRKERAGVYVHRESGWACVRSLGPNGGRCWELCHPADPVDDYRECFDTYGTLRACKQHHQAAREFMSKQFVE